ncbi:homoserine kinase [Ameyamaea chiangmaiensis NBRC 103196]|uniref:Homoserine kinase n=1 Tax=Ameyamaea chiangmaiensis TaxID=442969 RepID=A0A850PBH5_9PROT|nr:homoserine kinase [Ameyamaea chiangmaiensis]MBS4076142.1 homoserine kinase [Ameyamaea chiangmaiensis]NVN39656.1 homoserine kinase [Ameyamaea chiangmaiensis]GBQ67177.1 homoserine kinase [Ameyamaea chiangmaiensis NBRC 103196]
MAVYTDVSDEALSAFLEEYEIGGLVAFRGIAEGVENSNFVLRTTQGDFILTLYEKRVNRDDLPWFLGFMRHLSAHGLSCPTPVVGRNGEALRELAGRPAAITTFLPGVWPRRVHLYHCRALGEAMAHLHRAGEAYVPVRRNGLGAESWGPLLEACRAQGDRVHPGLVAEVSAALDGVLRNWPAEGALPVGHIHADLFPDNVFFLDRAVSGVIDFYFACTDMLAYDIAICLNAWCFEMDGSFNVTRARLLVAGYESVRPLTAAERASLPVLARGAALRFLLTRLYDWINTPPDAMVTRKDPRDYLHRLRFHLQADGPGAYGL